MRQSDKARKKVLQLLYSGLGGHGSVFTSFIEGDETGSCRHQALFYGIEPLKPEYKAFCKAHNLPFTAIAKPPGAEVRSVWQVYKALRAFSPDVVVLHSMNLFVVAWLYCWLHNCNLIPVEHTPNVAKRKSEWFWTFLSLLLARKIVYLAPEYVLQLRQKFRAFFPGRKAVVIPNGINTKKFACHARLAIPETIVFAMQSRFSPTKDHQTLLKAFAIFLNGQPDKNRFRLRLAGDGQTLEQTKSLAREFGVSEQVVFCGMLAEPELIRFLCDVQVYVHCSLAETSCTAVMQALACGLPVIASDIPGIRQLFVPGVSGMLVAPQSAEALAKALSDITGSGFEDRRVVMGQNARLHAEQNHSHTRMFRNYAAIW